MILSLQVNKIIIFLNCFILFYLFFFFYYIASHIEGKLAIHSTVEYYDLISKMRVGTNFREFLNDFEGRTYLLSNH